MLAGILIQRHVTYVYDDVTYVYDDVTYVYAGGADMLAGILIQRHPQRLPPVIILRSHCVTSSYTYVTSSYTYVIPNVSLL